MSATLQGAESGISASRAFNLHITHRLAVTAFCQTAGPGGGGPRTNARHKGKRLGGKVRHFQFLMRELRRGSLRYLRPARLIEARQSARQTSRISLAKDDSSGQALDRTMAPTA